MKSYVFPGNIEEDILQIAAEQIPYMRTSFFSGIVKGSEQLLLDQIHCKNGRVIFYTGSGTGAMDAVVSNLVTLKRNSFILAGGSFGYRWKSLCEYYHCPYHLFEVPFAKDPDYTEMEEQIKNTHPDVFLCQHHETSTGELFDLPRIAEICKKYGVFLVVDAISSFLSDPLDMDQLNIGMCITSSQKGLNIPPGLSFIFLSEKALSEDFNHIGYYFDFKENLKNLERGQTPYSPATTLFLQLYERLKRNSVIGVDSIIENVKQRALYFRAQCKEHNWIIPAETPSNCITGFFVKRNGDILFNELLKENIYIMPGSTPNFFRVSHLGLQSKEDIDNLVARIKTIEEK
ncbi:aminotransferase class V-fold PLP-dependent enzyme [uncultured Bacteroides sp.]|uniref:pyridoxal-phosphate-dependent aminotransferase family protein n=1 Tax=uncultured Bacteroides sp. TaxID=162156 RepID=UPI002AAAA066|nr:aminotransferase class V-fold PLP-dependent enzyme [uncultured Bacteroides sp.]